MLRLGRLTDYAITLLTQMVRDGKCVSSASGLAEKACLPAPTVAKVMKKLTKSGIVTAQRGASGGYSLARASADISVVSIVEAMEGPIAITDCAETSSHGCNVESLCPMSGNWNKINRALRVALDAVSLADMASVAHPHIPVPHLGTTEDAIQ
jgi:FeS assembly SUF system regulator